jgi:hypothetical protein
VRASVRVREGDTARERFGLFLLIFLKLRVRVVVVRWVVEEGQERKIYYR